MLVWKPSNQQQKKGEKYAIVLNLLYSLMSQKQKQRNAIYIRCLVWSRRLSNIRINNGTPLSFGVKSFNRTSSIQLIIFMQNNSS